MTSLRELKADLVKLRRAAEADCGAARFAAAGLSKRCRSTEDAGRVQVHALMFAAWAHHKVGDDARAEQMLTQATRKAVSARLADAVPLTRIAQAQMASEQGRHGMAAEALVALLQDESGFARLSESDRSRACVLLADLTLDVDPGGATDLALEWHLRCLGDDARGLPWQHAITRASVQLTRYLWCQDDLSGVLQARALDRRRVREFLSSALHTLESIDRHALSLGSARCAEHLERMLALAQALAAASATHLRPAALAMLAQAKNQPLAESASHLYLAAAGLVALGEGRCAGPIIEFGASLGRQPPARSAWWIHLQAEVAAQQGHTACAMSHYKRYVQQACAAMALQRMDMRDLIATLVRAGSPAPPRQVLHQPAPAYLERALRFIAADNSCTSVDLAAAHAGVSPRTLRNAFLVHLGRQPKQYIIERRLEAAHAALAVGLAPGTTIADLAHQHGFSHAGRFSKLYLQRYGQLPSVTRTARVTKP